MQTDSLADISIAKLVAGIAGSFVSLKFMAGTLGQRFVLAIGGAALSYFGSTPTSSWLGLQSAEGLVGFLIGMFGMAISSKVYEVISALDAKGISSDLRGWLRPRK